MSIWSVCLILLIAELNNLTIYQADVGNAYLEAYTKEKIYFVARKEFTTFRMQGHMVIISKALCRLQTSGKQFGAVFTDTLHIEEFTHCKANSNRN